MQTPEEYRKYAEECERLACMAPQFPTRPNREFPNAYQGIFSEEQGILISEQRKDERPSTSNGCSATIHPRTRSRQFLVGAGLAQRLDDAIRRQRHGGKTHPER